MVWVRDFVRGVRFERNARVQERKEPARGFDEDS